LDLFETVWMGVGAVARIIKVGILAGCDVLIVEEKKIIQVIRFMGCQ